MIKKILVTGGAGYIGTHTVLELLQSQYEVCVVDNYSNSRPESLARVRKLSNRPFIDFDADIRNAKALGQIMRSFKPDAVIHFAGLKAVGESTENPLKYYDNNVCSSLVLLEAMETIGCKHIVFSSSATVYGDPQYLPYDEDHPLAPTSPYGKTKQFVEEIIKDWTRVQKDRSATILRYFNPVGAHSSGYLGEDPHGKPDNLMPFISQTAVGRRAELNVFGNDFDTRDGTGLRDYIHVVDLARAHLAALEFLNYNNGLQVFNIGTGTNVSVLEMVKTFEKVSGKSIPFKITKRRKGDIAEMLANPQKAKNLLGWSAQHGLHEMCLSSWKWQTKNPNGYQE